MVTIMAQEYIYYKYLVLSIGICSWLLAWCMTGVDPNSIKPGTGWYCHFTLSKHLASTLVSMGIPDDQSQ